LSEGSRALARQKLRAMVFNIGGPTEWPELPFNITEDWFQNAILIARRATRSTGHSRRQRRFGFRRARACSIGARSVNAGGTQALWLSAAPQP
jgi:hypothetical protein